MDKEIPGSCLCGRVRFAVWDSAGNPGFVNAVWLTSHSQ